MNLDGLPPGAWLDFSTNEVVFRPGFIQGGQGWTVLQDTGGETRIEAIDSIRPPPPTVVESTPLDGYTLHRLAQVTDDFLDSPGYAGRSFEAFVAAPVGATEKSLPVRIHLHGFTPAEIPRFGNRDEIIIHPQDLENTYWWGYSDQLPGGSPATGAAPPYTQRRVLALLEWTLSTFPEADPERVWIEGESMGGAGAATLGLLHARHFAWVDARVGQTIARNHRPKRVDQLATFWGRPEVGLPSGEGEPTSVWEQMDLARALRDDIEARNQFLFLKHSKDDHAIHFGAVTHPSPQTEQSFYATLQTQHIGHLAIWDEGGHFAPDPVLGADWWAAGWARTDRPPLAPKRRGPFPAFSAASLDSDPGTGQPNGKTRWHPRKGYANKSKVPGDTGWDGDLAGGFNRHLRWEMDPGDETWEALTVTLWRSPAATESTGPITVDVTPRRTRRFRPHPGESLSWSMGSQGGSTVVEPDGTVTVRAVVVSEERTELRIRRSP